MQTAETAATLVGPTVGNDQAVGRFGAGASGAGRCGAGRCGAGRCGAGRWISMLAVPLVLLLLAPPAAGQAKDPKLALARKHFEAAETYYEQGQFRKALAEYKKSHSYKRFAAFIFNIAQCHRQLKEWKQALFNYKLYLSKKPNATNLAEVRRRIQEMERMVALQTAAERHKGQLTVITRPAGAQVFVNRLTGSPDGVSPVILKLNAGAYLVALRRKGYRDQHRQVLVKASNMTMLEVPLQPLVAPRRIEPRRATRFPVPPAGRPAAPVTPSRPRRITLTSAVPRPAPLYKRWWLWTGVVVATGLTAGGIYFGVTALKMSAEWKDNRGLVDDPSEFKKAGERARRAADVMLGTAGAVALGVIVSAVVVGLRNKEQASQTRLLPGCSAQGCRLVISGRF